MEINIRKPAREDEEQLLELFKGLTTFNFESNKDNRGSSETLEERIAKREVKVKELLEEHWETGKPFIFVATIDNVVVGYTTTYIFDDVNGYLDEMYVSDKARSLGIGKKLLENVSQELKDKGVQKLKLNVYLWNEGAIKLYENQGFKGYFMGCIKDL